MIILRLVNSSQRDHITPMLDNENRNNNIEDVLTNLDELLKKAHRLPRV